LIQRLSAGLSIALFALLLPNALALNSPDLPAPLLNKLSKSAKSLQSMGGQMEKTTNTQSASGDGSARSDGALLIRHKMFYLRRVTAYNALPDQTSGNPDIAACGANRPNQIALSQDLFFLKNGGNRCGERINIVLRSGRVIDGIVWDTMNSRYHMAADILMGSVQRAIDFGVKQAKLRFIHAPTPSTNGL
jgi:3D (Asp-Asp-Asp) domain-containing protein